jgi:23S rRNA pseudouridine1911/1915/1917 synthase
MSAPRFESRSFQVAREEAGLRGDVFLWLKAPLLSRTRARQKIMSGESLLNGRRYATSARLREGDTVELRFRCPDDQTPLPDLPLLYEDERLVAVDKPAGVPGHPAGRIQAGTVVQALRARYAPEIAASLLRGDPGFYPSLVSRLDRFSSGALLIAKDREMLSAMHRLVAAGGMRKRYLVLVRGKVQEGWGRIEEPIGPAGGSGIAVKRAVRPDGLPAVTEYRLVERLRGHTLLHAWPFTGRQHQIRVHFACLGHPVWGDLLYDRQELFLRYCRNGCRLDASLPPRQGLHAESLLFTHPFSGRELQLCAPLPADLSAIIASLRKE